jgi:hypothetical protein
VTTTVIMQACIAIGYGPVYAGFLLDTHVIKGLTSELNFNLLAKNGSSLWCSIHD